MLNVTMTNGMATERFLKHKCISSYDEKTLIGEFLKKNLKLISNDYNHFNSKIYLLSWLEKFHHCAHCMAEGFPTILKT